MLIELIRVVEFIVTCLIVFGMFYLSYRIWHHHALKEATKRRALENTRQRNALGPHAHAATLKKRNHDD